MNETEENYHNKYTIPKPLTPLLTLTVDAKMHIGDLVTPFEQYFSYIVAASLIDGVPGEFHRPAASH